MIPILPLLLAILNVVGGGHAQRPSNASTCDYYAIERFGGNTSETQFELIQGIVSLAFGGAMNLTNVSSDLNITGILNPGGFNGQPVDLRPWFDGSKESSNLNNQPVGINWLDGGDVEPLYLYLSGQTPGVEMNNTTNQYRLFNHFFVDFGVTFGCSLPQTPLPGDAESTANVAVAYVHKFMDLTFNDLGHFIDQLTRSILHYGFSEQDAQTFNSSMNAKYNVRCSPPITVNPAQGPQLFSLCQDPTCPLAEPSPDCAAYVNMTAGGGPGGSSTGVPSSTTPIPTVEPSSSTTMAATTTPTSTPTSSTTTSSSLSGGDIGGIVVGAVGVVAIVILVFAIWRRKYNYQPQSTIGTHIGNQMIEPPKFDPMIHPAKLYSTTKEIDGTERQSSAPTEGRQPPYSPVSGILSPTLDGSLSSPKWSPDPGRPGTGSSPGSPPWDGQQPPFRSINSTNPAELEAKSEKKP